MLLGAGWTTLIVPDHCECQLLRVKIMHEFVFAFASQTCTAATCSFRMKSAAALDAAVCTPGFGVPSCVNEVFLIQKERTSDHENFQYLGQKSLMFSVRCGPRKLKIRRAHLHLSSHACTHICSDAHTHTHTHTHTRTPMTTPKSTETTMTSSQRTNINRMRTAWTSHLLEPRPCPQSALMSL